MIYISTRNRVDIVRKTLPKWLAVTDTDATPLRLVVEDQDVDEYAKLLRDDFGVDVGAGGDEGLNLLILRKDDQGVGYSRAKAVEHAIEHDYAGFITTDDDLWPRKDPRYLLQRVSTGRRWVCGGYFSIYDFMSGGKIKAWDGSRDDGGGGVDGKPVVPTRNGMGFQCFALNTACAAEMKLTTDSDDGHGGRGGGGLADWRVSEDQEIFRRGVWLFERPWYIDTSFGLVSVAKRGSPGGMSDFAGEVLGEAYGSGKKGELLHEAHKLAARSWGTYVSDPAKCENGDSGGKCNYRMKWKQFLQDNNAYVPW